MEKLIFVSCPEGDLKQIVLTDYLTKHISTKSAIFYISPHSCKEFSGQIYSGYREKNFAETVATSTKTLLVSLGETISADDMGRRSYKNLWRWINDFSHTHIHTVALVVPTVVLPNIHSGSYLFRRNIKNIETGLAELNESTIGVVDFGEQYWPTENFFVQVLTDKRFQYIKDIPWQLLPSGYESQTKDKRDTKDVLDKLVLDWLNVAGNVTSWARNRRSTIWRRQLKLAPYLHYKEPKLI